MTTKLKSLMVVSALVVVLTTGSFVRADENYSGGVTVDIDRDVLGYLCVYDATVNLLKNAHIKNAIDQGYDYGYVVATSGCVLNIRGGQIDDYLYVTTTPDSGFPEAVVAVYGYGFAIDGVPVAEGTPEVFMEDNLFSGFYEDGTPFSYRVSCLLVEDFYLTVKLGWLTSRPDMSVSPQSLDFGQVKVGQSATQIVTVANTGNANLFLQTVSLVGDSNPGFSTPLIQLPITVEPNESVSVEVIFSPTEAGEALGVLRITGDDSDTPSVDITLTGVGIVPEIAVEPVSMDFGQMNIGTSAAQSMTIANHGDAQLIINSLTWTEDSSADFAVAVLPEFPLAIEPNGLVELSIVYTPTVEGAAAAILEIQSDDPDQPMATLAVTGGAVNPVIPPLQQMDAIIAFYNESVQNGTIVGVGPGHSAQAHVKAIRNMLLFTRSLIRCGYDLYAAMALTEIAKFTDGQPRPKDMITGPAVAELNAKIETLITTLKTQ